MENDFDNIIIPSITGCIASFITWLIGRKKENVEVQSSAIDNVDKAVKMWQDTAEKMSQRVDELSDKVDNLTKEVHSLRIENADLKLKLGIDENHKSKRTRVKAD
jgi:peptidoglycan hydrolase CwlO-like protein